MYPALLLLTFYIDRKYIDLHLGQYIFLGALIEYTHLTNDDRVQRWSSVRNRSFLYTWLLSEDEKQEFLNTILAKFLDETYGDITEMCDTASGFIFERVIQFDVRSVQAEPNNLYFHNFGSTKNRKVPVHPVLKSLFHRSVIDPRWRLKSGHSRDNLCIPACVLLTLHSRLGVATSSLNMTEFEADLNLLNYKDLLSPEHYGIKISDTNKFEDMNTNRANPNLGRRFPALKYFVGIACNYYYMKRKYNEFRLFPYSISRFSRSHDYFQSDFLISNNDIRPKGYNEPIRNHVMAIKSLARFVCKLRGKAVNSGRYTFVCNTCFSLFSTAGTRASHWENDCSHEVRGVLGFRKSKNSLLHQPFKLNRYTHRVQLNGLSFRAGDNFKRLKTTFAVFLDFESYNTPVPQETSIFIKPPKSSLSVHTPCSYAYVIKSFYKEIQLPDKLQKVRLKFYDDADTTTTIKDFYINLLLNLRNDLVALSRFLNDLLESNRDPPKRNERTLEDLQTVQNKTFCDICGRRFHSWFRNKHRRYQCLKSFDHCHLK